VLKEYEEQVALHTNYKVQPLAGSITRGYVVSTAALQPKRWLVDLEEKTWRDTQERTRSSFLTCATCLPTTCCSRPRSTASAGARPSAAFAVMARALEEL